MKNDTFSIIYNSSKLILPLLEAMVTGNCIRKLLGLLYLSILNRFTASQGLIYTIFFFTFCTFLLELGEFKPFLKHNDEVKPIWIFTRDGHDGPRFPTTRQTLIKFFKDNDIDFLVAVYNAAGFSAYHFI